MKLDYGTLFIVLMLFSLSGCGLFKENIQKREITEAFAAKENKKVDIDRRLLEKCPTFIKELQTGEEGEVIEWAKDVLKTASDCRKAQHILVDEVIKIFQIQ